MRPVGKFCTESCMGITCQQLAGLWTSLLVARRRAVRSKAGSFAIPAWAFDRGNVRVFTEELADAGPMVAFGGRSPVFVEYDLDLPAAGAYQLEHRVRGGNSHDRCSSSVDGKTSGPVCRSATGSWNTSGAKWEESAAWTCRPGGTPFGSSARVTFPIVVALRLSVSLPFQTDCPAARRMPGSAWPSPPSAVPETVTRAAALRLAINDLATTFGPRYPKGEQFLQRLDRSETQLNSGRQPAQARPRPGGPAARGAAGQPAARFRPAAGAQARFSQARRRAPRDGRRSRRRHAQRPHQRRHAAPGPLERRTRGAFEPARRAAAHHAYRPDDRRDADRSGAALRRRPAALRQERGDRRRTGGCGKSAWTASGLRQVTPDDGADVGHFDPVLPAGWPDHLRLHGGLPGAAVRVRRRRR